MRAVPVHVLSFNMQLWRHDAASRGADSFQLHFSVDFEHMPNDFF
jgi:hypothetical protein